MNAFDFFTKNHLSKFLYKEFVTICNLLYFNEGKAEESLKYILKITIKARKTKNIYRHVTGDEVLYKNVFVCL